MRALVALTHRFLAGEMDAATYDARYRRSSFTTSDLAEPLWQVVDRQWHACEAHVEDPGLRDPGDLDDDDLRAAARRMLADLAALDPALAAPPPRLRFEVLHDLLELHALPADCLDELRDLPWDGEELVVLMPRHPLGAIADRDRGALSDAELVAWAQAVETRDDIGRPDDEETRDVVDQAVLELANPELFPTLSPDLVARLEAADRR